MSLDQYCGLRLKIGVLLEYRAYMVTKSMGLGGIK